jgi:hypothetical protein
MVLTTSVFSFWIRRKKIEKYARDMGIPTPFTVWEKKWRLQRKEEWEADRARKAAEEEEERAQMKLLDDTIVGLCASESLGVSYFRSLILNILQLLR